MAEPVQIIASFIGIADLAWKSYRGLYRFVSDIKNADNTAKGLCCKVQRLRKTLYNVHLVLLARENQLLETRPAGPEEACILSNIRDSLKAWRHTLQNLKRELKDLKEPHEGDRRLSWVDKTFLQLKLQRKAPTIGKFERSIDEHIEELSLSLHCLTIFLQTEQRVHGPALRQKLQQVEPQFNGTPNGHNLSGSQAGSEIRSRHTPIMDRCITTARTVVERISPSDRPSMERQTSFPGKDGTSVTLSCESHEQDREDGNSDGPGPRISEIGEVTVTAPAIGFNEGWKPDFDPQLDIRPQEFLDALIKNYRSCIEMELKDKCYDQAEDHQRKLIERLDERKKAYGIQYEWAKTQEQLADILQDCGKIDEAIEINRLLLQEGRDVTDEYATQTDLDLTELSPLNTLEQSRHYYKIAKLRFMQYKDQDDPRMIQLSETFARRSLKLRLELCKEHEAEESAKLLADVYQLQGNHVEADTCRALYCGSCDANSISPTPALVKPSPLQQSPHDKGIPADDDNRQDSSDLTALFSAVGKGDDKEVERLLRPGTKVDSRGRNNRTLLMHAIQHRQIAMVRLLCSKGAKVNAKDDSGWTALHHAVMVNGEGDEIARILFSDYGADCNAKCHIRKTPLHYTVDRNNVSTARILLSHDANIQAEDIYHRTPLAFAQSEGRRRRRLARILQDHEAEMNWSVRSSSEESSLASLQRHSSADTNASSCTSASTPSLLSRGLARNRTA